MWAWHPMPLLFGIRCTLSPSGLGHLVSEQLFYETWYLQYPTQNTTFTPKFSEEQVCQSLSHPLRLWEGPDFPFPVAPSRTECCLIPIMHKLIQYHPTSLDHFELILIFLSERKIFFHLPLAKCLRVNMSANLVATYLQNYCRGMWLWSQGRPCTWGICQGAVLFLIPLYRLLRQSS